MLIAAVRRRCPFLIGRQPRDLNEYQINKQRRYDLRCSPRGCVLTGPSASATGADEMLESATPLWRERAIGWMTGVGMIAFALVFIYAVFQMLTLGFSELETIQSTSVSRNLP